ncbi:MAG: hypothetical protein ACKVPX_16945 [Myxococcaceae bacterium]
MILAVQPCARTLTDLVQEDIAMRDCTIGHWMAHKPLGQWLIEAGSVTPEQLHVALEHQRNRKRRIGTLLVELGYITEHQVTCFLAKQLRVPWVDLDAMPTPPSATRALPPDWAERFRVFPVEWDEGAPLLRVATADPTDLRKLEELTSACGIPIVYCLAGEQSIRRAIRRWYSHALPA